MPQKMSHHECMFPCIVVLLKLQPLKLIHDGVLSSASEANICFSQWIDLDFLGPRLQGCALIGGVALSLGQTTTQMRHQCHNVEFAHWAAGRGHCSLKEEMLESNSSNLYRIDRQT
jgi:hypothetical protein|uniref:Uncharacterized protein n=1 Tax=Eutreptiella gymnastica TaxID=73025 RepID=A0A7S4FQW5_9EUGL